ncbi:MAG TPA: hypothetical protein VL137_05165 [Polyangiaceae bacterium]|nr:hypothetical protein [Polyangiaceae bacterium]
MRSQFRHQSVRFRLAFAMIAAAFLWGCNNLDRFDTTDGSAYCGQITDGRFVREGFQRQLELQLHIDTSRLQSVPGDLTSFDKLTGPCKPQALFSHAALRVPQATLADPLSTLQLDESHDYNFVAWVQSSCQGPMLAVVSLMKSGAVEVRLLDAPPNATSEGSFGVFHLQRQAACSF